MQEYIQQPDDPEDAHEGRAQDVKWEDKPGALQTMDGKQQERAGSKLCIWFKQRWVSERKDKIKFQKWQSYLRQK